MPITNKKVKRAEIRRLIKTYSYETNGQKGWYQNVRFGFCLETRRKPLECLTAAIRRKVTKEDIVISNLPDLTGKTVIDIGCNAGLYSIEACCKGARSVLGVDKGDLQIQQARAVADLFRRMGRPIGQLEFHAVQDIQNELALIDDKDVLIACCVLYHLGPLERFKARIVDSNVKMLILQGNVRRLAKIGQFNNSSAPCYEPMEKTWGNVLGDITGLRNFCTTMGFEVSSVVEHNNWPVVIAKR